MKRTAAHCFVVDALACGTALWIPLAVHAADWQIAPTARVATTYIDNPRMLESGGDASAGAFGEFSASLRRLTERSDISLQPRLRSARYREDESLDSNDQLLDAKLRYIGERSEWNAAASFARDATLTSELGSTGLVQSNRRRENVVLSGGPTYAVSERSNVGAQAYWSDTHYVDADFTGLVDYEYRALSLFSDFDTSEASNFTVTAQGGELVVPDFGTRTRNATLRLGWTYRTYSLWTAKLSAGPAYVDAEAGNDSGAVFDADLERRGERWTMNASVGRSLTPTGRGVLTRRDRIVLGANRRLTENLSSGASMQWIRNEDLLPMRDVAFYENDYGRVDVNLSWRVAEHWSLAFAVSGATQHYEANRDAENYRASVSVIWNGQPHSL